MGRAELPEVWLRLPPGLLEGRAGRAVHRPRGLPLVPPGAAPLRRPMEEGGPSLMFLRDLRCSVRPLEKLGLSLTSP